MARRKKKSGGGGGGDGWLVTFSDLMTLLLTFFVLLLSMASMDTTTITRISSFSNSLAPIQHSGASRMSDRVKLVIDLVRDHDNLLLQNDRIKDLLFPDDIFPPEMNVADVKANVSILQHPEGVVIVLTDGLLFAEGSAEPDARGRALLDALTPVIHGVNADVNISGHTDSTPQPPPGNDELSARRALAVLERFLAGKVPPDRFSISAYGPDKPMYANDTPEGRRKNRRVEILLKTAKRLARYT